MLKIWQAFIELVKQKPAFNNCAERIARELSPSILVADLNCWLWVSPLGDVDILLNDEPMICKLREASPGRGGASALVSDQRSDFWQIDSAV